MWPSSEPENATPGMALTAPDCAGLQRGRESHGTGGVCHTRAPSVEPQREHPAAALPVGIGELRVGQHHAAEIRQRHVDVSPIGRGSPLHAAHRAAFADARLPERLALRSGSTAYTFPTCGRRRALACRWAARPGSATPRSRSPGPSASGQFVLSVSRQAETYASLRRHLVRPQDPARVESIATNASLVVVGGSL